MSIVKLNNRSVKDITAFGSISSLGSLTHIATQTASSSSSISFTSGIDSTYKEYIFYFNNIHPVNDGVEFSFNMSVDSGSNYNVTINSSSFRAYHSESGSDSALTYDTSRDSAQSTDFQLITPGIGNQNDECSSGFLHLFNPSSTTFVKHFITNFNTLISIDYNQNQITAGYGDTTSAVDAIQFKFSSGNIDSGDILLFGLN